jgi:hypothetical protein
MSTAAPREQKIISLEHTAPGLAVAKVRVRIGQSCFVDYLVFHCIDGKWLVTSKAFHIERTFPPGRSLPLAAGVR